MLGLLLLTALTNPSAQAQSVIYKCVSLAGATTYTNSPCQPEESTSRISSKATAVSGLDCRIAHKLAVDTTERMKRGETSQAIFDSHGGLDSLSPLSIGLISYIYSFNGNASVSTSRVATLATERCQVGSFGTDTRSCLAYPHAFIEKLGGCELAQSSDTRPGQNTPTGAAGSEVEQVAPGAGSEGGNSVATSQLDSADVAPPASYALPDNGKAAFRTTDE